MKTTNLIKKDIVSIASDVFPLPDGATYGIRSRFIKSKYGEVHGHTVALNVNFEYFGERTAEPLNYAHIYRREIGFDPEMTELEFKEKIDEISDALAERGFANRVLSTGTHLEFHILSDVYYKGDRDNEVRVICQTDRESDLERFRNLETFPASGSFYRITKTF